jgi:exopolyphosphatase/guanosine-5'-triphosphate,3'-diphosphate pyrophosphatase
MLPRRHIVFAPPGRGTSIVTAMGSRVRLGAIDVGSNALRLRIGEWDEATREIRPMLSARVALRLGADVFRAGSLGPETIDEAVRVLGRFRRAMKRARVAAYRAVATSATREADNGTELVRGARRRAGIDLDIIDGVEEARLVRLAVREAVPLGGRVLLADLGGGSTELTLTESGRVVRSTSLPLGTVRLLEAHRLGGSSPPTCGELRRLSGTIDDALTDARGMFGAPLRMVATGGNAECILSLTGAVKSGMGPAIDTARLRGLAGDLGKYAPAERAKVFDLRADRADTILPATYVFARLARVAKVREIASPGVGVRDGILAELSSARENPARTRSRTSSRGLVRLSL